MFEIFSWLKVCVSFLPRSPGVSFHKRTKLFLMLFFKLWNMADFLAENRKLLSSALTGPLLYLYFLYGSSSKFWTVKLRRKNLISDIHKKNETWKLFTTLERHILQSTIHRTSRISHNMRKQHFTPMQNPILYIYIHLQDFLRRKNLASI